MTTRAAAAAQNELTMQMLCPKDGCPDKIYLYDGYYIPGNPWVINHQIELYKVSILLVIGCLVWEYAVTWYTEELPRWMELCKGKIVFVNILTLLSRYFAFAAAATTLVYVFDTSSNACQFKVSFLIVCVAIMWLSVSLIYTLRIFAMYSRPEDRRTVRLGISIVWFICAALWITSAAGYKAGPVNPLIRQPFGPGCTPLPSPQWHSMGFGAGAIFDVIVLVLSLRSVSRHSSGKGLRPVYQALRYGLTDRSNTSSFIVVSSSITFLISFPLNTICFFVLLVDKNLILYNIPIAIAALFNFMICSRLVFHSNQWSQGKSALLTMPQTYFINKDNRGGHDGQGANQRAKGFNAFTAAIAKRKIPNHPFDQLTIEQAIEEHARMDAIAWRDYMRTGAPDDVKAAVVNAVMEEQNSEMDSVRRNSVPITPLHQQDYCGKSSIESSTRPNSIRGPTRYSSKLEMELAQMDASTYEDHSDRRGSSTRRGSSHTDDEKEFISNDQPFKPNSKLDKLTGGGGGAGSSSSTTYTPSPPPPPPQEENQTTQYPPSSNKVPFPNEEGNAKDKKSTSPLPNGWTRTPLTLHPRTVSQTSDLERGMTEGKVDDDAPFSSHVRSFTPQPEDLHHSNASPILESSSSNPSTTAPPPPSTTKRTAFKDVFKRQKSNEVFDRHHESSRANGGKPVKTPIVLRTEVVQTSDRDNFI